MYKSHIDKTLRKTRERFEDLKNKFVEVQGKAIITFLDALAHTRSTDLSEKIFIRVLIINKTELLLSVYFFQLVKTFP